jgi:hypothetical protein
MVLSAQNLMKNSTLSMVVVLMATSINPIVNAQATGNETYNENNRFRNNGYYKSEEKAAPAATYQNDDIEAVSGMAMATNAKMSKRKMENNNAQWNYGDASATQGDLLINQVQNNLSSYYDGSDFLVRVHVLYNAAPSSYMAIFHMNQAGKKVQDIDSLMSKRVAKLIAQSHSIGLKKEDFYTDMIALVPIFEKEKKLGKNYVQVPKGFEMQKNLHVKYKTAAQLDALFTLAAQCEIYDLIKVEYFYDSTETANQILKNKAVQVLNQKLKTYKQMGISLDTNFRMVQEQRHQYFPIDEYRPYQPLAVSTLDVDEAVDAAKSGVTQPVNTQRTTMFYNQVSSDGFDAVINPSPLSPTIQFVYNVDVRFKIHVPIQTKTETIKQTDLLIITPQGTIKEITK